MRSAMESMFSDFGVEIDLSDLKPNMSPDEMASKSAEIAERIQRKAQEAQDESSRSERSKSKRQLQQEERMRQVEEARKKTIASIYKQLAKALHPDLELDEARRQRKVLLMQELTLAYRNNDLHTLLRLELEWIQREEGDLERLTEDKLAIYNQVLNGQAFELEREIAALPLHPRYQRIVAVDDLFDIQIRTDGPAEAARLGRIIPLMEASIMRLKSGDALKEVYAVIREYRSANSQAMANIF
jgi:hypothetical protein